MIFVKGIKYIVVVEHLAKQAQNNGREWYEYVRQCQ